MHISCSFPSHQVEPVRLVRPAKARRLIAEVIQAAEVTKFRNMVANIKEQMWRLRRHDNNVRLELAVFEKVEEMLQVQAQGKIIDCLPSEDKPLDCTASIAALEVLKDASVMKYVSGAVQSTRKSNPGSSSRHRTRGCPREVGQRFPVLDSGTRSNELLLRVCDRGEEVQRHSRGSSIQVARTSSIASSARTF